jgi:sialate O-acetylesterase
VKRLCPRNAHSCVRNPEAVLLGRRVDFRAQDPRATAELIHLRLCRKNRAPVFFEIAILPRDPNSNDLSQRTTSPHFHPPMKVFTLLLSLCLPVSALRAAELRLADPFTDHAILQLGVPVPVWGTASAGETVQVTFAGQTQSAVADADGRWRVTLDPLKAGDSGTLRAQGRQQVEASDVQAGEVWLCAGDSFMSQKVRTSRSMRASLSRKDHPAVRLFRPQTKPAPEPRTEVSGTWTVAANQTRGDFPALAYEFARVLHSKSGVPVGIVEVTDPESVTILRAGRVTGSTVEAWISEPALRALPAAAPLFEFYASPAELRDALTQYETALGDWKLKTGKAFGAELKELEQREPDVWYDYVAEMRKAGKPAPSDPPRKPTAESLRMAPTHAANLYNGMIAPLAGLAVRGVVLNLGLANAPRATQFRALFPALIADWRKAWGRADLPFVFLQQGRIGSSNMDPRAASELRAAQADSAAHTPRTALVRVMDLPGNMFPEDIPAVAARMEQSARRLAYGDTGAGEGPVIDSVRFEGSKAIVQFRPGTSPLSLRKGDTLRGFALTERPNRWAYAEAQIEGDRVVVSHPEIKAPVALRYDWIVEPGHEGNLTDASGLPALPYRSDDWPSFTDTPAATKPNASATLQPSDLYPVVNPALPRVLLIGDSIMNGYSPFVIEALKGRANVVRLVAFGMIGGNDGSASVFCEKLRDGDYALIHYNDGLHSLPPRITDEQFGVGLTAMFKHLKTVTPHVVWATTTPAPDNRNTLGPGSLNGAVVTRNEMSKKIAAEFGVPVIDLYGLVIPERETLQGFANLHFTPEGSKRMGSAIAARILELLEAR